MGDLQVWAPQPNGFLKSTSSSRPLSSSSSPSSNPPPLSIAAECLQRGEETTCEIIYRIQPTVVSEQRRKDVVDYIQRLIRGWVGCEVFPFGSVPLKTYLPDGDIDLTTVSCLNVEEALANEVRAVLEGEEQNPGGEFEIKDVQYIHAEVKLVKCLVQNIVIDISFNQLGGLCTLCFLEQVDHVIGKNHLFKRSIILIKAWCYYESRILGAHHGLISTYALETLVLYIFHLFHSSLNGPLAVLYRFLDYFSKFDWDNYCISLHGPVAISSLPEIVAETPETDGGHLLLSKEFLKSCVEMFSTPPRVVEANVRAFPQKHLNIIDPMKENNNLGRSVSKGNFYRIRSAFAYGARKLGRILLLPPESIGDELKKFFQNTLDRHGSGQRPDVHDPIPAMPYGASGIGSISFKSVDEENPLEGKNEKAVVGSSSLDSSTTRESKADYKRALIEDIKSIKTSGMEKKIGMGDELQRCTKYGGYLAAVQYNSSKEVGSVSGSRLAGDAQDLATARLSGCRTTNEACKSSSLLGNTEACSSLVPRIHHAPHLYFSGQFSEDGKPADEKLASTEVTKPSVHAMEASAVVRPLHEAGWQGLNTSVASSTMEQFMFCRQNADPSKELHGGKPILVSSNYSTACSSGMKGQSEISEGLTTLSDLSGDFDSHLKCLFYGNYCHEYVWSAPVFSIPPPSPSGYRSNPWDLSWELPCRSAALERGAFPHASLNGIVPGPQFPPSHAYYSVTPPLISGAFNMEDMPKTRGTGTYFPNMNHRSYKERQSPSRGGRNSLPCSPSANNNQLPRSRNNGWAGTQTDLVVLPEKGSHEPPSPPPPPPQLLQLSAFGGAGHGKNSPVEFVPAHRSPGRGFPHANGLAIPHEQLEFGTFGPVQLGSHLSEQGRHADSGPVKYSHGSEPLPLTTMPRPELVMKEERVLQAYRLKDEEDFPPLSV